METATYIIVQLLLILSGDIELNPGPTNLREHSVSVLHCNMRSIRNRLEHIIDNFCDFDCLSFTETHLDDNINNAEIFLTTDFSAPYRKDRTNHGGGILVYICPDTIESEEHFLLNCNKYDSKRKNNRFISEIVHDFGKGIDAVKHILNPQTKQNCKSICNFIGDALHIRKYGYCYFLIIAAT